MITKLTTQKEKKRARSTIPEQNLKNSIVRPSRTLPHLQVNHPFHLLYKNNQRQDKMEDGQGGSGLVENY